jgi:hypothetical protein
MSMGASTTHHLDGADLVRVIDAEGSPDDRRRWDAHLAGCGSCRQELEDLRAGSVALRGWLERAAFEAGPHRAASRPTGRTPQRTRSWTVGAPWLKAAAVLVLLAGPVVAIPGARERVVERLGMATPDRDPAPLAVGTRSDLDPATVVTFQPAPGLFHVRLRYGQSGGRLVLERADAGTDAVLRVTGEEPRPGAVVSARGLDIENEPGSVASYTLRLPGEVTDVVVTVGDRRRDLSRDVLDRGVVLPLDRVPGTR